MVIMMMAMMIMMLVMMMMMMMIMMIMMMLRGRTDPKTAKHTLRKPAHRNAQRQGTSGILYRN